MDSDEENSDEDSNSEEIGETLSSSTNISVGGIPLISISTTSTSSSTFPTNSSSHIPSTTTTTTFTSLSASISNSSSISSSHISSPISSVSKKDHATPLHQDFYSLESSEYYEDESSVVPLAPPRTKRSFKLSKFLLKIIFIVLNIFRFHFP
jgi:hypothetical protein